MPQRRKSNSPNAPRLDPQARLLGRFYEPLVLLCALGKTRGEHRPAELPRSADVTSWPLKYARRLFLTQLAFLCDYATGGDSVTAIGVQQTPGGRLFWVAANVCPDTRIVPFLRRVLKDLKDVAEGRVAADEAVDLFLSACTDHARSRIKAYRKLLAALVKSCRKGLASASADQQSYEPLLAWLDKFLTPGSEPEVICKLAYESRRSEEMRKLKFFCGETHSRHDKDSLRGRCTLVRHYIGRLGQYMKISRTLCQMAPRLAYLMDNFAVCSMALPPRMLPPPADGKTNLESIVKRMLPASSPDLARYQRVIAEMDTHFKIFARYMEIYCDSNFKPRVHAEVQVLNHFYENDISFEDADRFVACSKPACYCCSLYFRHHPLRPVQPASHQNIYRSWRPPDFVPGDNIQRDILNKMIADMRVEALEQMDQGRPNRQWHPDSTTGITATASHVLEQTLFEISSEMSHSSVDFDDVLSEASSFRSDKQTGVPEAHSLYGMDEMSSSQVATNSFSDWEEDSDESGGVLLTIEMDGDLLISEKQS